MKKKLFLLICLVFSFVLALSSCKDAAEEELSDEKNNVNVKIIEQIQDEANDNNQEELEDENEEQTKETDKSQVQPGDIVFTGRESIVFEYYVEDPTGKTTMKVTMSQGFIRVDIPDIDVVGVVNTNDDTGFIYYKSNFGKISMSFYNLGSVEAIAHLNLFCENIDDVENLERTTLDGRDCVYGELEDDGDVLKLWYSEEYNILLQYIMDSSDGVSTMKVTSIDEFGGDMEVFEMPAGCIDLGTQDAQGQAFTEFTDDLN